MQEEKRWISSKILFEAISEELAANRQAAFTVTGMSMWPFLCHGRDQVIVEAADLCNMKVGDIILFKGFEETYILHRITGFYPGYFETTGDGNLHRDGKFPESCSIAKVNSVIRKGKKDRLQQFYVENFIKGLGVFVSCAKIYFCILDVYQKIYKEMNDRNVKMVEVCLCL